MCDGWDLWWLYFEASGTGKLDEVLNFGTLDSGRFAWARVICVPLMSVSNTQVAQTLMERVIAAAPILESAAA